MSGHTGLYAGQIKFDPSMDSLPDITPSLEPARGRALGRLTRSNGMGLMPEEKAQLQQAVLHMDRDDDAAKGENYNRKAIDLMFTLGKK